jgi:hypothetical protein
MRQQKRTKRAYVGNLEIIEWFEVSKFIAADEPDAARSRFRSGNALFFFSG